MEILALRKQYRGYQIGEHWVNANILTKVEGHLQQFIKQMVFGILAAGSLQLTFESLSTGFSNLIPSEEKAKKAKKAKKVMKNVLEHAKLIHQALSSKDWDSPTFVCSGVKITKSFDFLKETALRYLQTEISADDETRLYFASICVALVSYLISPSCQRVDYGELYWRHRDLFGDFNYILK